VRVVWALCTHPVIFAHVPCPRWGIPLIPDRFSLVLTVSLYRRLSAVDPDQGMENTRSGSMSVLTSDPSRGVFRIS
jgi:hypothetical protein